MQLVIFEIAIKANQTVPPAPSGRRRAAQGKREGPSHLTHVVGVTRAPSLRLRHGYFMVDKATL